MTNRRWAWARSPACEILPKTRFSLLEPSDRKAAGSVARCNLPDRLAKRVHQLHKSLPLSARTTRTSELTIAPHQDGQVENLRVALQQADGDQDESVDGPDLQLS